MARRSLVADVERSNPFACVVENEPFGDPSDESVKFVHRLVRDGIVPSRKPAMSRFICGGTLIKVTNRRRLFYTPLRAQSSGRVADRLIRAASCDSRHDNSKTNHRELKMKRLFSLGLAVLLASRASSAGAADKVDLATLLPQMTDLSLLADYPDPPFVTKQFSSYDRGSEAPGKESWFANADRGFMLYDGVLGAETAYFKSVPKQGLAPEGHFAAGTHVGISPTHKRVGGYVWVYATAADGRPEGKRPSRATSPTRQSPKTRRGTCWPK